MKLIFRFIIPFILLFFIGCNKREIGNFEVGMKALNPVRFIPRDFAIDTLQITMFPKNLTFIDSLLFISATRNRQAVLLDRDFNLFLSFKEKQGRGPGEFLMLNNAFSLGSFYYFYDLGNGRMNVIDKNTLEYIDSFVAPVPANGQRAALNDSLFIYDVATEKNGISIFDYKLQKTLRTFGNVALLEEWEEKIQTVSRNFFLKDQTLITVYSNKPYIQVYSLDGELLNTTVLSEYSFWETVWGRYREINKVPRPGMVQILFNDSYLEGDFLYLAAYNGNGLEILKLKFDQRLHKFEPVIRYNLLLAAESVSGVEHVGLFSFAVSGDRLVLINNDMEIMIYELSE